MRILILTGDAGEAQEIYYAKYRLEEEGWQVQIAAPTKRPFLSVVHDFDPGFDTYTEKAFRLLRSPAVRQAFHLDEEDPRLRDHYGRTKHGQSVVLARRAGPDPRPTTRWGRCSTSRPNRPSRPDPIPPLRCRTRPAACSSSRRIRS